MSGQEPEQRPPGSVPNSTPLRVGAYIDRDTTDDDLDGPPPTYAPDGNPGATGAELDKIIERDDLPEVPFLDH